jgi:REP element-mobilizing transposase RayT
MPDHLHALVGFPPQEQMLHVVRAWKKFGATHHHIAWQRDFFDHRLRRDESFDEKAAYIRMNPVRAGLVTTASDWPYVLAFDPRDGSSA